MADLVQLLDRAYVLLRHDLPSILSECAVRFGFWDWPFLWLIGIAGALWSLWGVYHVVINPPNRTRLRFAGISDRGMLCIKGLFLLAGLEASWSVFSAVVGSPIAWDFLALGALILSSAVVWFLLSRRKTFKSKQVAALVFSPIGLGITGALPVATKIVDQAPTVIRTVAKAPIAEVAGDIAAKTLKFADDATAIGIVKPTVIGKIQFPNTTVMGGLGDQAAVRIMTAQGCKKMPSKFSGNRGIDGVFTRHKDGQLVEVIISESKVNGSKLEGDQMTQAWVLRKCDEMDKYADADVKHTARVIRQALDSEGEVTVSRQLIELNFETGQVTCSKLDNNASVIGEAWSGDYSNTIGNVLSRAVEGRKCKVVDAPASGAVGPPLSAGSSAD